MGRIGHVFETTNKFRERLSLVSSRSIFFTCVLSVLSVLWLVPTRGKVPEGLDLRAASLMGDSAKMCPVMCPKCPKSRA